MICRNPFIYRAKLWEVATGKEVRNFKDISPYAVALTNDGKLLAFAKGHDVVLQDLATGKEVRTFKGHPNDVSCLLAKYLGFSKEPVRKLDVR